MSFVVILDSTLSTQSSHGIISPVLEQLTSGTVKLWSSGTSSHRFHLTSSQFSFPAHTYKDVEERNPSLWTSWLHNFITLLYKRIKSNILATYLLAIFIRFPKSDAVQFCFIKTFRHHLFVLDCLFNFVTNVRDVLILFVFVCCIILIDPF